MSPRWLELLGGGVALALALGAGPSGETLFRDKVAPILTARCVRCHGRTTTKGGLSLTSAASIRVGGESGPAVVPGQPDESLLIEQVEGESPAMPRGGEPLSAGQVADLRRWIAEGAPWPEGLTLNPLANPAGSWWAFQPLRRPPVPPVTDRSWARTPIDAFILHRLQEHGLRPNPEADRRTLIRRLTFDLHGLPPSPEEIDRFLQDPAPDAYERLVDRLLASPRYGERWARHWLDIVHYADTHGYDKDKRRDHAWPYRDYVIRALNRDIPYARFVREQVAGDVLDPASPDAVAATGFVAAGPWDFVGHVELGEGTVEKARTRLLDRDDMLASTLSTFNSLTAHCARCHDHKFDPIPQRDYYRLQAVFAGVERGDRPLPDRGLDERRTALEGCRAALRDRRRRLLDQAAARTSPTLKRLDAELGAAGREVAALAPPAPGPPSPTNGYHSGIAPRPDVVKWVQVDLGRPVPIAEVHLIPARPVDFPDTPGFGFPVRFQVELSNDPGFATGERLLDQTARDLPTPGDVRLVLDAGDRTAQFVRVTATRLWKRTDDYVFALAEIEVVSGGKNVAAGAAVTALDSIESGRWGRKNLVDGSDSRHRLTDRSDPSAWAALERRLALERAVRQLLARRDREADALIDDGLRGAIRATDAEWVEVDRQLQTLPPGPKVYALIAHPPRPIHQLRRGDVEQPGDSVTAGSLSCIPGLPGDFESPGSADGEGSRRAALAEWLVDSRNALTWRSIVNRVWQYHFGRGIVGTPNDFGRNGEAPTHPELLDWLAVEFLAGGQSLKALHRAIVTSAVYRQSSAGDPARAERDADNRLLWRMDRRRLDAEEVRDAILAVSGTLDVRMGGPGFDLFRFKDDHSPVYDHAAVEKINDPRAWRRTVYRFVVRSVPNPFLECFDGADPNANTPVRSATITALQALALLNDPFLLRQSEEFASRLAEADHDPAAQIVAAYRRAFSRMPHPDELHALRAYTEHHGLANTCRLLFNTNEFLFID